MSSSAGMHPPSSAMLKVGVVDGDVIDDDGPPKPFGPWQRSGEDVAVAIGR